MKNFMLSNKVLPTLLICLFGFYSFAQESIVKGKVTEESGEVLPGVNIVVEGTLNGTISDFDGNYQLKVKTANPVLVFSFIGYEPKKVPVGGKTQIDVVLSSDSKELEAVVVTAQLKGQIEARNEQVNSNTIKNVVAPDRLQENPDANAAEAIGRLPGVSVMRSGGEGSGLVVRGLSPQYTKVTLNGVDMPSTGGADRSTNISGVSQYALEGVEVFKSLTADLDANAVAGAINLKLKETQEGFRASTILQTGYNSLENYYGNYKLNANVSNRFFKDKFGVSVSLNTERVNRSTETMTANLGSAASSEAVVQINNASLNDVSRIKHRQSGSVNLDYRVSPSTSLMWYNLYTRSNDHYDKVTLSYNTSAAVSVNANYNTKGVYEIFQSALSGTTKLAFLNDAEMDYGVAHSKGLTDNPDSRRWGFQHFGALGEPLDAEERLVAGPEDIINMYSQELDYNNLEFRNMGYESDMLEDKNLSAHLNVKIPFEKGIVNGHVKFGGKYRKKERYRDVESASSYRYLEGNKRTVDEFEWANFKNNYVSGGGFAGKDVGEFLGGDFTFGNTLNFDRLNAVQDWWTNLSNGYLAQGPEVWEPIFSERSKIGYLRSLQASVMEDQNITENYYATYLMAEVNIGKYLMLLPGVRYEKTDAEMHGWSSFQPFRDPGTDESIPGDPTSATRDDEFLLPMIHARIKPTKSFYIHGAFTQTLSRPNFNVITPNEFTNIGTTNSYRVGVPDLKAEFWNNYDVQMTYHDRKIGLFSVSGFYKTVEDKIWTRSYFRIKGDPLVPGFDDNAVVNLNVTENHPNEVFVKGLEAEWQTSFWYLPQPFTNFTMYLNYTLTDSETQYTKSEVITYIPPGERRPVKERVDTMQVGVMLNQPKHIANASLGYNKGGLNMWLSFQYNGEIFSFVSPFDRKLSNKKDHFYRWDFQVTQKLPVKGLQVMLNLANLSDFVETTRKNGDPRPSSMESYGWTADLGIRYRF